ncbi:UNVERIFIED_CONTAM: Bile salt export pump [Trichonephila clavipes]
MYPKDTSEASLIPCRDVYDNCLAPARKQGIKRGLMTAIGAGLTWFCIFAGYALAFWYGVKLVVEDEGKTNPTYTGGTIIIVSNLNMREFSYCTGL